MFYYYLRFFLWFSGIFGLHFPFPFKYNKLNSRWFSAWSSIISAMFIGSYFYPNNIWSGIKVKMYLDQISGVNNLIVNVIIILFNICDEGRNHRQTYATVNNILRNLHINKQNLKLFTIKLYLWTTLPLGVFITSIIMEFIYSIPPYTLITKMPIFISLIHLFSHLSLLLAVLKVVNLRIFEKSQKQNNFFLEDSSNCKGLLNYLIRPSITFFHVDAQNGQYDLHLLCKVYDEMGMCITLLQKSHGIQLLLSIWLMFSNAITGITMISKEWVNLAWVVVVRSTLPIFWYFIGCYIDNHLQQEVERTESLIVKHLIDFRCERSTREVLQTFIQVVAANRLQFTACNLFRLNYSTILGTVVNIITYSIILIQVL